MNFSLKFSCRFLDILVKGLRLSELSHVSHQMQSEDRRRAKNHRLYLASSLTLAFLMLYALESAAVPPEPRVYGMSNGNSAFSPGQPLPRLVESPAPLSGPVIGPREIVVILVEFQDVAHNPAYDVAHFNNLLFSASNPNSMYNYYYEASYGQMPISGVITGWHLSKHKMSYYGADDDETDGFNGPVHKLAREAVKLANAAGFDFSRYDKNRDGNIDHIIVVHAGPAQETGGRSYGPNAIWSHHWLISPYEKVDGVSAAYYSMVAESSPIGTIAHEFGHDLGLPDLYDTDGSSSGIGSWGLMGLGAWLAAGDVPAHPCAWSKILLGWAKPRVVTADKIGLALDSVENSSINAIVKIPFTLNEYFLLENRRKIGFDQYLPGDGILIWHIDDSVGDIASNDVNNNEDHKRVDLEEADGLNDLDSIAFYGDANDPYYLGNVTGFGNSTTPDSRLYSGKSSNVSIVNVSASAATMTLDILFSANPAPVALAGGPYAGVINAGIEFDGSGSFDVNGDSLIYKWDFDADDGIQVDSTRTKPAYSYATAGIYTVTLIVNDGKLNSNPSTTTVDIQDIQEITISLDAGWNLISLYLQPTDTRLSSVLSSADGKYDSVWTYDSTAGQWSKYVVDIPPFLNDLDRMESGVGYWIMMDQPAMLIVQGTPSSSAIPMKIGWNLVGYTSQTSMPIQDYPPTVGSRGNAIWTYNSESGEWLRYDASMPAFLNNMDSLQPGNGYWIDANQDFVWDIGDGEW